MFGSFSLCIIAYRVYCPLLYPDIETCFYTKAISRFYLFTDFTNTFSRRLFQNLVLMPFLLLFVHYRITHIYQKQQRAHIDISPTVSTVAGQGFDLSGADFVHGGGWGCSK